MGPVVAHHPGESWWSFPPRSPAQPSDRADRGGRDSHVWPLE